MTNILLQKNYHQYLGGKLCFGPYLLYHHLAGITKAFESSIEVSVKKPNWGKCLIKFPSMVILCESFLIGSQSNLNKCLEMEEMKFLSSLV